MKNFILGLILLAAGFLFTWGGNQIYIAIAHHGKSDARSIQVLPDKAKAATSR